jgi:hypothetical protein
VTRTLNTPVRWISAAGVLALLLIVATAGSARAATYPKVGGSTFSGSAEGWSGNSECSINILELGKLLLCPSEAGYNGAAGNPPGSLRASGTTVLNVVGLFKTEGRFESPNFTVGDGGGGSLSLQRAFTPGGLALAATMTYNASLVDKTTGTTQKAITETVAGEATFGTKSGGVNLVAGHTYAVVVESETSASVVGLLTSAAASFDNVTVSGPGSNPGECPGCGPGNNGNDGSNGNDGNGDNGSGGSNGANGLTAAQLEKLIGASLSGATMKGNRVTVKGSCPAAIGVACKTTLQGMAKKGKPATSKNTAKIAKGKGKQISLRVKPKVKSVVAKRRTLLFKVTVKAGSVSATVLKTLKLKHSY